MMHNKCTTCNRKISSSWYYWSFHWTEYVCPGCGTKYNWTKKRKITSGIIGGLSGATALLILLYLDNVTNSQTIFYKLIIGLLLFGIMILVLGLVQLFIPGLFCKSDKQPFIKSDN